VRRLAELVRDEARARHGLDVRVVSQPAPGRTARPSRWLANVRAAQLAPWFPATTLEAGVREMLGGAARAAA
jgi:hypothetical protein